MNIGRFHKFLSPSFFSSNATSTQKRVSKFLSVNLDCPWEKQEIRYFLRRPSSQKAKMENLKVSNWWIIPQLLFKSLMK